MSERDELTELLNEAVSLAAEGLTERTELLPFALAMQATDGEIFHIDLDDDDPGADHALIVSALRAELRDAAAEGRWRAVAVVADVTLEDDAGEAITSALRVWLEHSGVEAVDCTIPYSIDEEGVDLGELATEPGESHVFGEATPPS